MKKKYLLLMIVGISLVVLSASNINFAFGQPNGSMLKMVSIDANSPEAIKKLVRMNIDITAVIKGPLIEGSRGVPMQTYLVKAVVSAQDEKKLGSENYSWSDVPGKGPVKKIGEPYEVYKSFDAPKIGIKAQLNKIHSTFPKICHVETIGYSIQGRQMLAMRLTNEKIKGEKPQVLFVATHHAREWIATEMAMRLIKYLTSNFGSDERVTDILNTTEVWVIPVANPDGYQYTFTNERLWRKNLRDNDGNGEITIEDGVDLNRNFEYHWGLDNEGSSPITSAGSYRGTAPNSEPETQAVVNFIKQNNFKFIISYHSYGNNILYPWGWQVKTTSLDDPIFVAQAGTDGNPSIFDSLLGEGYDPGVGADIYIMNGEFTDWTYGIMCIPSYMVEFTKGYDFRFPDDEDMVHTVFEDSLDFALSVAESAVDPAHPVSPVGISTNDVYHTPVTASYGPNQMIEVLARKELDLTLTASGGNATFFTERLGSVYNDQSGTYYSRYVAYVEGQTAGATVTYEIKGGNSTLGPYSYSVVSATGNPILIMSAEDYTGEYPDYPPGGPFYLSYYTDALDEGGYLYDVWNVDVQGVPSFSEVISHYDVAIWYTGDDYAATKPNGFITHMQESLAFRDFINYQDGKLFATGQDLAWLSAVYGPIDDITDDFFQYYLGAYRDIDKGGIDPDTNLPYDVVGEPGDPVFGGLNFSLTGGDGADNQCCSSTFLLTNYFLPHFEGIIAARYDQPGGAPHSGDYYVYSQMDDMSYKRLGGTFTIPSGAPTLKFWMSYNIESEWDYAFVEIAEVGSDNWTTLPDANGLTTQSTGDSCVSGWVDEIHPFLAHYMDTDCNPSGTTGEWHAFTGSSGGWKQVEIDLSAYAGKTVELFISYATDWATVQWLGVFVDDIELSGYSLEDFETGMGDWVISPPPEGSYAFSNWIRIPGSLLPESPAIRTGNSVYLGFGFEAIDTSENRNIVMDRVIKYLYNN